MQRLDKGGMTGQSCRLLGRHAPFVARPSPSYKGSSTGLCANVNVRLSSSDASSSGCRFAVSTAASSSGKLGDVSLFGGDSSGLLSGTAPVSTDRSRAGGVQLDDVPLSSDAGLDYSSLREALRKEDLREADDETRALLIKLAGPDAVKRGWVYFTEAKSMPARDLQVIDALWRAASNNRFGYRVQKEIWTQNRRRWPKFFKQIDWVVGGNNNYRKWPAEFMYSKAAPKGHLPLTNALRGTQLFQAILEHPAFETDAGSGKQTLDQAAAESAKRSARNVLGL